MASETFVKDMFRNFFSSFFKVIGYGIGIILILIFVSVAFKKPPGPSHTTNAHVVPNDEWKQDVLSSTTPTLVKLNIVGAIGLDHLTHADVKKQLIDTINGEIKQDQVKGVLLYVDSPGGTADDSDAIYRLLLEYKKRLKIPVYAYVEGMCASGGMLISCASDKIFASPSSVMGSVGVLIPPLFNFSALLDRLGVQSKTISSGKDKDELNPFRPWKPDEGASIQAITNNYYERFLSIVSTHRPKLTKEVLLNVGATIYSAPQAVEMGYADALANSIDDTMKALATDVGIQQNYQVVEFEVRNWLEELFEASNPFMPKKIQHEIVLPGGINPKFQGKVCYLYCPEYNLSPK